ncbi:MAG: DUF547 domain-containing protein [Melioribacteraceae bacterium]|nr:DUF547 domain-containing protein [Melioribacteraceae bacterium]
MKKTIIITLVITIVSFAQNIDHSILTNIMSKYNFNGNLDYYGLTKEAKLNEYLNLLSNVNPSKLESDQEKIAFWINVYNAFTIKAIVDNYPVESINDLHSGGRIIGHIFSTTVWDDDFIEINNKEYSLNDVEHKILRKEFKEPRIHFAIVCASISCPQLRHEAYSAEKLEEQLQDQTIKFFGDQTKNKFDEKNKIAYLSKILDWFEEDFGENNEEVLKFVSKYLNSKLSSNINEDTENWSIDYLDYDWGLNEHKN